MKRQTLKTLYLLFTLVIFLTSCGGANPSPKSTPTSAPANKTDTPTATPASKGVIEPENVVQLQILKKWEKGNVFGVALSPDETSLAVSTVTGVYLYDAETLQQKQFIDLPIMPGSDKYYTPNKSISFSPDGIFLAIGYDDTITIWNLSENKYEKSIHQVLDYEIAQIEYSPNGNTIVVMSMGTYFPCDATGVNFALYETKSGNLLHNDVFCPEASLYYFTFLNNGNVAFVGRSPSTQLNQASIVDGKTGVVLKKFSHQKYIDSISPDGSKISIRRYPDGTDIVDTNTQKSVDNLDGIVIFLPDNKHQLVATQNDWEIITSDKKTVCDFENRPSLLFDVYRSAFTLVGNKLLFWDIWFQNVEIWDMSQCKLLKQLYLPKASTSFVYSADGNFLATHGLSNIHLFNTENGGYKFSIPGNYSISPRQYYYNFSRDSKIMVAVSLTDPYKITFWDTTSGKLLQSIQTEFESFNHVAFVSGDATVATRDKQGLHFWDIKNQKLLYTIPVRADLYFNTEKDYFAVRDDDHIVFHRIRDGSIKNKILIPTERLFDITFSKNWALIAVAKDENIELWNIDGNKLRELTEYPAVDPTAPPSILTYDIKFSPNNNLVVAIRREDGNYSLRFWDTRTGTILRDIPISFEIFKLEFSPDGKNLAVLGNGMIYIFGITPSE